MSIERDQLSRSRQDLIASRCIHPQGVFAEFPRAKLEQSVVALFERMVDEHPHRLALKHGKTQLTYAEFERRINRLSQVILRQRGDKPEPIALLISQGAEALIAVMAVLKAGKFYVVLDEGQPAATLRSTMQRSGARVLVCDEVLRIAHPQLAEDAECVINVSHIAADSDARPNLSLGPKTLAFVTYTSGSTSQPKGVLYTHDNIAHQVYLQTQVAHPSPADRVALARPYGFNGAVKDIYTAFLTGASIFPLDVRSDGLSGIVEQLRSERITMWYSVASTFRALCHALEFSPSLPDLRYVMIGGERIQPSDISNFQSHFSPGAVLMLNYGITETASTICAWLIDHGTQWTTAELPVGRPIDGIDVRILDEFGNSMPCGSLGEIAVTGRYLARGYWNDPELTRKAFIADPVDPEWVTYRTGDLGRFDEEGCLTQLGRKDSRVKIRGHFVDPAEIEQELRTPEIGRDVAVVARPNSQGELSLAAYIVPARKPAPTVSAIRSFLLRSMPDYMVPAHFVMLDTLPKTSGGKIDRKALPDIGTARPDLGCIFEDAQSPFEVWLVGLWQEVLGIDEIGVHDDFFELGGDSLHAMRLMGRLQSSIKEPVQVLALFDHSTVSDFARFLQSRYPKWFLEEWDAPQIIAFRSNDGASEMPQSLPRAA